MHRILPAVALLVLLPVPAARPQNPTLAAPLAFDAVSIREAPLDPKVSSSWYATSDSFRATTTVEGFIQNAWDFVLQDQIVNLPAWAKSDRFTIAAKMDPETYAAYTRLPDKEQDREWDRMMQAVLTTRFHLQAHPDTRLMQAYALVIARGGPKVKPAAASPQGGWSTGPGRITAHSLDLPTLASLLSGKLGQIVVDRSGLTGHYDLTLTWTPDNQRGLPDSGPSLFTAVQKQLGLRLESTRAPVPTLVIDHIEKPSAN